MTSLFSYISWCQLASLSKAAVGQSNTMQSNAVMVTSGLLHEAPVCHPQGGK